MLSKHDFEYIKNKIVETVHPDAVYIFGSYAQGNADEHSDIDIAVIKKGLRKKDDFSEAVSKVRKSLESIDSAKDILIFNSHRFNKRKNVFGSIQYEIYKKGLKLYEKKGN